MTTYKSRDKPLTVKAIEAARGPCDLGDANYPGLRLAVGKTGVRRWYYRFNAEYGNPSKKRKVTLGYYPTMGLREARDKLLEARGLRKSGVDPGRYEERRRQVGLSEMRKRRSEELRTMEEFGFVWSVLLDEYYKDNVPLRRKTDHSLRAARSAIDFVLADDNMHNLPVSMTSMDDIRKLVAPLIKDGKYPRTRDVLTHVGLAHRYGQLTGRITPDQVNFAETYRRQLADMKVPMNGSVRTRLLSDREVSAIWNWLDEEKDVVNAELRTIFKLCFTTGARSGEICGIEKRNVHLNESRVYLSTTKNGLDRNVMLSDLSKEILTEYMTEHPNSTDYVFASNTGRNQPINQNALAVALSRCRSNDRRYAKANAPAIEPFTLHDTRRYVRTTIAHPDFGASFEVKEWIIGHITKSNPVIQTYDRSVKDPEALVVLQQYADHLRRVVGLVPGVVPLRRKQVNR